MYSPKQMQKQLQFIIGILALFLLSNNSFAQDVPAKDSVAQINVKLIGIFNQKTPQKYKIRNIKVVGNQNFDENLLLSLSTLNVGDDVTIPGGDNFAKAIHKLMDQNYFSDVSVYLTDVQDKLIDVEINVVGNVNFDENLLLSLSTLNIGDEISLPGGENFGKAIHKLMDQNYFSDVSIWLTDLVGNEIDVEIAVVERPRLSKYNFIGVRKSETDELSGKTGLTPNRVITQNMKITAVEGIKKYYAEKGFQDVKVTI